MAGYAQTPLKDENNKDKRTVWSLYDVGDKTIVVNEPPLPKLKMLPAGVYRLGFDEKTEQLWFENVSTSFDLPEKIYGESYKAYANVVYRKYRDSKQNLGFLMTGTKGSGKSMIAEIIGNKVIQSLRPVIMLNGEFSIQVLERASKIAGPCMFYWDEFSKYLDRDKQNQLLPFFSSTNIKETLFVIADNETNQLSPYILDRPGRFRYHIRFSGISRDLCDEICKEHGITNKEILEHIYAYIAENKISIDVMRVLAQETKECKDYKEYLARFDLLNIPKPTFKELLVTITFPTGLSAEEMEEHKKQFKVIKTSSEEVTVSFDDLRENLHCGRRWENEVRMARFMVKLDFNNTSVIQPPPGSELVPKFVVPPATKQPF